MDKPKRPLEPNVRDKVKYPTKIDSVNYLNQPIAGANPNYVRDYHQYQKDLIQYAKDMELYEQLKFIKIIKVAKEKFILKKFQITKRDKWIENHLK